MKKKRLSTKRILELLADPQFNLIASESPWAFADEIEAVNNYLIATTPKIPKELLAVQSQATRIVGRRVTRVEDPARLTGQAIYASDVHLPGMLHTAILRSPYAHAAIEDIDTSAAEALEGVRGVLTYKNGPKMKIGGPPDQFVLNQEVHFAGEEVATVAAEDIHTAREALDLIKVTYRVLPSISDPEAALRPGAANLLSGGGTQTVGFAEEPSGPAGPAAKPTGNRIQPTYPLTKRGNFDAAYAAAPIKLEGTYHTSTVQHGTLEPRVAVARWEGPNELSVWVSTQYILGVRAELAALFGLPRSRVRVFGEHMGGGFGDKSSSSRHGRIAAVLAKMTQRPVRVEYDRPGNFKAATHRYATVVSLKAAADRDGTLKAYRADAISDSGAYAAFALPDVMVSLVRTYHAEDARFAQTSVLTNRGPSGFQRCVGNPQGTFAQEIFMDELAEKVGINPLDFRLKNVETWGDQDRKLPWASCGIVDCLQEGAKAIGWQQKWHRPGAAIKGTKAHGIGMSAHACAHGSMTMPMTAMMKIDQDGSLDVIQPTTDIGGGQATTMMMIGAETVGVTLEQAHPSWGDTAFTPDSSGTNGSRQTISAGNAVRVAGLDL
ncbi:MAG: xanthine dehydrogenase family protein molybdopterin-binding subunit, partial [Chloroflexota bacterium]|nr:xanthine dehydrogenase family protein molybdopterin-binding subunit [Chloroflexota bacterium]